MNIKSWIGGMWAKRRVKAIEKESMSAWELQQKTFKELVAKGRQTAFGKAHGFEEIRSIADFQQKIPVRNYEQNKEWFDRIVAGEPDISWPGKPLYLAKTSGTTSGAKYIPITDVSIKKQIQGARDALLCYMHDTGKRDFLGGKMMFLSGSPELQTNAKGMKIGRLSGIVNHYVPSYLTRNRVPTYETNIIEDWEEKVGTVVGEVAPQDLRLISGIPPWVQMLFEDLKAKTGKEPLEVWPNLQLFVQGGVDFSPYKPIFDYYFKDKVDTVEVFPASEGFFAFQNAQADNGLLLMPDYGIFYEFVPMDSYGKEGAKRLTLNEVELGVQYAMVISTNAGLWAYDLGDTVKFTSLRPYKLRVTGRVKHFISAFGEHVISEEVNQAILKAVASTGAEFQEFTVAPLIVEEKGDSAHEWFIEFVKYPEDMERFRNVLDEAIREQNPYYEDLRQGNILKKVVVHPIELNASRAYMKSQGKLGGQNKFPRLSNDRKIANFLQDFVQKGS